MCLLDICFLIPHFDSGCVIILQGVNLLIRKVKKSKSDKEKTNNKEYADL